MMDGQLEWKSANAVSARSNEGQRLSGNCAAQWRQAPGCLKERRGEALVLAVTLTNNVSAVCRMGVDDSRGVSYGGISDVHAMMFFFQVMVIEIACIGTVSLAEALL